MKFLADNFGPVLKTAKINLMLSGHTHRNSFHARGEAGQEYPVLVNSNNSFVEIYVDKEKIRAVVRDVNGGNIAEYEFR